MGWCAGLLAARLLLWGALNASFLTRDLFNFYVSLELLTVSAVAVVILGEDRSALTAAMRYLLAAFLASLLYLLGVAMLYGAHSDVPRAHDARTAHST